MRQRVVSTLALILLVAVYPGAVLHTASQEITSRGEVILTDESLFRRDFISSIDMKSLSPDSEKLGYVLPEENRPGFSALKARHGEPDDVVSEKAPRVAPGFSIEQYKLHQGPVPVKWAPTRVHYYGNIGFGVDETDDTVSFVTNRSASPRPPAPEEPSASSLTVGPAAQNNFDGNWDEGITSSNLFFTVVDNAITNATIVNLRMSLGSSSCNDGGIISTSYDPPAQISDNEVSFSVSGYTGKNVWIFDLEGTFSSDTSISGSESILLFGNCGFVFSFTSFHATRQPDYVLFTRPSIRKILSGESTSFTVGVNPLGSFNQTLDVQMLVPTVPGVTLTLSSDRIRPGESATLDVTTASNAPSVLLGIVFRSATGQATHDTVALLDLSTFEITITPGSQVIGKAGSATFSVNTRTAQFRDRVNLSSSISPSSGVTANLASSSLVPGESTSFRADSTATTPSNTYTITIKATAGQISESATATLRVTDPDFELAIVPGSQQVGPGGSVTSRVDVKSLVGFSQPVSLSTSISPDNGNLSASLASNSVAAGGSTDLTANASASAVPNSSFTITVKGTFGALTHSTTTSVSVKVIGPDFSLGFSSPTVDGYCGAKSKIAVTITRTGGFTGEVTVTPPYLPEEGITPKFGEPITTSESSAAWKFKIKGWAAIGPHQLTFSGRDGSGRVRTATVALMLQN